MRCWGLKALGGDCESEGDSWPDVGRGQGGRCLTAGQMWEVGRGGCCCVQGEYTQLEWLASLLGNWLCKQPPVSARMQRWEKCKAAEARPESGQYRGTSPTAPVQACFQPGTCTLLFLNIIYVEGSWAVFARQVLFVVVVVVRQEMKVWCCFDVILDCCLLE